MLPKMVEKCQESSAVSLTTVALPFARKCHPLRLVTTFSLSLFADIFDPVTLWGTLLPNMVTQQTMLS